MHVYLVHFILHSLVLSLCTVMLSVVSNCFLRISLFFIAVRDNVF